MPMFTYKDINAVYTKSMHGGKKTIYDLHCHLQHEFIFVEEGCVEVNLEGKKWMLSENTAIAIPAQKYHIVWGQSDVYKRLVTNFSQSALPCGIADDFLKAIETAPVATGRKSAQLFSEMADIVKAQKNGFEPLFESCLTRLFYFFAYENKSQKRQIFADNNKRVDRIIAFINGNIDKKITLESISQELFLSPSSISHIFKEEMQISVKQYVLQKKIYYAAELIKNGMSAAQAADAVGYENYASFYEMFFKIMGYSPIKIINSGL